MISLVFIHFWRWLRWPSVSKREEKLNMSKQCYPKFGDMHAALCPIILPRYYNISLENPHVSCDDHTDMVGAVALPDTYDKKILTSGGSGLN